MATVWKRLIGVTLAVALGLGAALFYRSPSPGPTGGSEPLAIFSPDPSFGAGDEVVTEGPDGGDEGPNEDEPKRDFVPRQLLVSFERGTPEEDRAGVFAELDVTPVEEIATGAVLVELDRGADLAAVRERAGRLPSLRYVEPNFIYRAADVLPNDSRMSLLWGLENRGTSVNGTTGTLDADMDAAAAWAFETGSSEVKVAVIDSGVAYGHPDLTPNIWSNPAESGSAASDGVDNDRNGYVDDHRGWDWIGNDNDPVDENAHGSHVAGTIGARGNDGFGVTGVNWEVSLMALRVLDAEGSGTSAGVADAMSYAVDQGAKVVNLSLGGPGSSRSIQEVIVSSPQTLFVVSAGNDATDNDAAPQYPCNVTTANLICVAASTQSDGLASFSNYGTNSVDVAAPGTNILSTVPGPNGTYGLSYYQGTSMATPQVAGAAALLWAAKPNASTSDVRSALFRGVDNKPAFAGKVATGGRVNVMSSLTLLTGAQVGAPTPVPPTPVASSVPSALPTSAITPTPVATPTPAIPTPTPSNGDPTPTPVASPTDPQPDPVPSDVTSPIAPPTASPDPGIASEHPRKITFKRPKPRLARGRVVVLSDFYRCQNRVPVVLFRNGQKAVRVLTDGFGYYRAKLPSRRGRYRATAPAQTLSAQSLCLGASADLPSIVSPERPDTNPGSCWDYSEAERGFASRINARREAAGRRPLHLDPELSRAAREHTNEMVARGSLSHTSSDDIKRRVTKWRLIGANVGVGSTVDSLHNAFVNSPPHLENILHGDYRHVGVSVHEGDRMWVTVIFEGYENPGTTLKMPNC